MSVRLQRWIVWGSALALACVLAAACGDDSGAPGTPSATATATTGSGGGSGNGGNGGTGGQEPSNRWDEGLWDKSVWGP
jgi:hypothetical protein